MSIDPVEKIATINMSDCESHRNLKLPNLTHLVPDSLTTLKRAVARSSGRGSVLPGLAGLPTIPALLDRTRMVRSLLPFPKHLALAIGLLGLSVCGVEFGLHLHDACLLN